MYIENLNMILKETEKDMKKKLITLFICLTMVVSYVPLFGDGRDTIYAADLSEHEHVSDTASEETDTDSAKAEQPVVEGNGVDAPAEDLTNSAPADAGAANQDADEAQTDEGIAPTAEEVSETVARYTSSTGAVTDCATLEDAVALARQEKGGRIELLKDTTIAKGETVVLPFEPNSEAEYKDGENTKSPARAAWNNGVSPNATLVIPNNVTMHVEGKLVVGAVRVAHKSTQAAQGITSDAYAQVVNDGVINVKSGGTVTVRGLMTGGGKLIVNKDATLYEPFIINDFVGGSIAAVQYGNGLFPFGQYTTMNVQCVLEVHSGGKDIGLAEVYASSRLNTSEIPLIDTVSNNKGIVQLNDSGSVLTREYDSKKIINESKGAIDYRDTGKNTVVS